MKRVIQFGVAFMLFFIVVVVGLVGGLGDSDSGGTHGQVVGINLNEEVLALKPYVLHYARYFGIGDYIWHLLAIMQVESGGRVEDVMQSSESLGLPPNTLSRMESIRQGVRYFSQLLDRAEQLGADLDTAIQGYNYGIGFVAYVANRGGRYTFELAMSFARRLSGGVRVTYTNPIAVAENGGWRYRYGNMFYVRLVHSHLSTTARVDGFLWPSPHSNIVTSPFGWRIHPISGIRRFHAGIDIAGAGINGTPILAVADGIVSTVAYNAGGWGNFIIIDHGGGYQTLYAHNARNMVRVGEHVQQGQQIATVGSTGSSTGPHIHFEVIRDGVRVDPLLYFRPDQYILR